MKLYYSPGAASLAPHILLEELGMAFEPCRISLADNEHNKPEFLAVNPRARVPALAVNGHVLTETIAILQYLAYCDPSQRLWPWTDAYAGARCAEWLSWLASVHHAHLILYWRAARYETEKAAIDQLSEAGKAVFDAGNRQIESLLQGPWAMGEEYSIVDPFLMFCYRQGNRIGIPMRAQYPKYSAWADRMLERPATARVFEREQITIGGKPW